MPINVRPEFMEAAEEHLKEFDPSTEWKDSALTLAVAAILNWRVLFTTPDQICMMETIETIKAAVNSGKQ